VADCDADVEHCKSVLWRKKVGPVPSKMIKKSANSKESDLNCRTKPMQPKEIQLINKTLHKLKDPKKSAKLAHLSMSRPIQRAPH
jgi:hypothetical protein